MRTHIFVTVALLSVALAGCSDDPPSGEVSGSSVAVPSEGTVALETQDFQGQDDPTGSNPQHDPCPFDNVPVPDDPAPDPVEGQRCEFAATSITVHMMSLPDPQADSYMAFLVDSSGVNPIIELGALNVNGTPPNMMYEISWDNIDECDGNPPSEDPDPCNRTNTHDTVEVRLGEVTVATADLSDGASFGPHPSLQGTSFSMQYTGRTATLELSGTNSTLSYEAVFYTDDGTGTVTAQETKSVSAGTNEISTDASINTFAEVHIHVAGTKVNLARGQV